MPGLRSNGFRRSSVRQARRPQRNAARRLTAAIIRRKFMLRDLRLAARMLLQAKGWTAVVLVSLALGIGANTALFSAINGLLLRKLPVSDPDSLVRFRYAGPNQMRTDVLVYGFTAPDARGRQVEPTFSYPMYLQFLADNRTLSDLVACAPLGTLNVVVNGQAEIASGFLSSGNYYRMLGATARLGRTFAPDDDLPAAAPVAVISHKYLAVPVRRQPERRRRAGARQQRPSHDRRRTRAGIHGHPAGGRRRARCVAAARARAAGDAAAVEPAAVAAQGAEFLVASGDGPAEARRHRRTGARQFCRRLSARGARAIRLVSFVAPARGTVAIVSAGGSHRHP